MVIYCTNSLYVYAMVGDPNLSQHGGQAYPCTNAEGLFITDADKCLSHSLPFKFLSPLPIFSLIFHPPKNNWCTRSGGVVPQSDREEVPSRQPSGDNSSEWGCCRVSRRLSFVPSFLMHGYWAPNQVDWPRPIRSELHVVSLKRPKHAVHEE